MKKLIQVIVLKILRYAALLIIALLAFASAQAQIATWNLTSATTTATSTNANLTASAISVIPLTTLAYQTSPGDIYCGTWSTSSAFSTTGKYWEFSITPKNGFQLVISSVTFKAGRTAAGPAKIQVQYSLDDFATNGITALGEITNSNTSSLDQFSLTSIPPTTSSQITFRIWGYVASSTGNFRLNNIVINGSVNSMTALGGGIGSASVSPYMFKYNEPTLLQFVVRAAGDTINGLRIIKPTVLNWDTKLISISPDSIKATFLSDTVQIANINLTSQDSLVVTIADVNAVDTTDVFSVDVQTYKGTSSYGRISSLPQLLVYGSPRAMSQVKAKDNSGVYALIGKHVVVKGVVTVANEFGGPAYVQDTTAGISVYDSTVSQNVNRGDKVVLLGVVSPYQNMFELNPCSLLQVISQGNSVDTTTLTIASIKGQNQNGVEPYECRLIRVSNITSVITSAKSPATTWGTTGVASTLYLISGTDTLQTYIKANNSLCNTSAPSEKFDMVGVLGQYYTNYQILPRTYNDIIVEGAGPRIISGVPYESNITSSSITFTWQTDLPGSSIVIRGLTTAYTDTLTDTNAVTQHKLIVTGLAPATIYHVKIGSAASGDTTLMNDYIVSTTSQSSKGTMNVYFNHSVNTALAKGENAQNVDILSKVINRINGAKYSVDAALYSLSGIVGANIATALISAKGRGTTVRVIGEYDNHTTAPWTTLTNSGITVIFDTYDATNAGAGLMHNKFFIIDMQDTTSDTTSWVISGSWNATDPGNTDDAQNVIEIQDKALANAYTTEFNEMWGSNTSIPNATNSRFGAHKLDNTPHYFNINGIPVESYFSPSDGTTGKIIKTLNKATKSIEFGILTFTRNDIANVLIAKKKAGFKIHGVMDNRIDQGSVFDTLVSSGVDVHLKGSEIIGLFHHKYSVVDGETNNSLQYVITGSHNWSSSAENANNENTLIITSPRIANLYMQEFSARYAGAGGTDALTGVKEISSVLPVHFSVSQNYPNPFNPSTTFQFQIPSTGLVTIKIYDILGREVMTLLDEVKPAGVYQINWDASALTTGVYFYKVQTGTFNAVKKAILLK